MSETPGTSKWVNVDELSRGGGILTQFEPAEIVVIKGHKFTVQRITLAPLPELVLAPAEVPKE